MIRRSIDNKFSGQKGVYTTWAGWNDRCGYPDNLPREFRIRDCIDPKNPTGNEYMNCDGKVVYKIMSLFPSL